MTNGQYRIPDEFIETPEQTGAIRDEINHLFETPETISKQEVLQFSTQAIEQKIDELRFERLAEYAEAHKNRKWLRAAPMYKFKAPVTADTLLSQESVAAGKIFGENMQFWLHHRDETALHRDWYVAAKTGEAHDVLHYVTTPEVIYKFHNATEKPFVDGEIERFVQAVNLYHTQVRTEVYGKPTDYDLAA